MFLFNGKPIGIDDPITVGDINYPPYWVRLATPEQRAAIGITEVPDPVRPDDRFYIVSPTLNAQHQYDATPRDLLMVKGEWLPAVKAEAHARLAPTDWMVLLEVEEPGTMSAAAKAYRKSVRTRLAEIESLINACKDIPTLQALVTGDMNWPLTEEEKAARRA